ncbi:MAG: fimbrial protein [Pseudomonas sp.]
MHPSHTTAWRFTALTALTLSLWQLSGNAQADCRISPSPGVMTFQMALDSYWVPRDAALGTVIGEKTINVRNDQQLEMICQNPNGTERIDARLPATAPIYGGSLPPVGGKDVNGRVIETNIPGVGAYIDLAQPYTGGRSNYFEPDDGTAIPYTGVFATKTAFALDASYLRGKVTLIKIGDIAPGPQRVDRQMFEGSIYNLGKVMEGRLTATVQPAQCALSANAVSADPVELGAHPLADFTGKGSTTLAVPFHINLTNCVDDANGSTARAHIRLDGANGSVPLPQKGVFSLTTDSDAKGIGIRMLHRDGSPVELNHDEPVTNLSIPETRLDFQAQYYQTEDVVTAGLAKGSLNFTISYR